MNMPIMGKVSIDESAGFVGARLTRPKQAAEPVDDFGEFG
jgi:hypothetical protein